MSLAGKQYGTRAEADAIRNQLSEGDPSSSFFVFEKDGGWIVAKVPTAPSPNATGSATQAKPKPEADDPRDNAFRNIPPIGGGFG
jgi:hypothetical protein